MSSCLPAQLVRRARARRGNVETVLDQKDERGVKAMLLAELDLAQVLDRDVEHLSGARPPRGRPPRRAARPHAAPRRAAHLPGQPLEALGGAAGLQRLHGAASVSTEASDACLWV